MRDFVANAKAIFLNLCAQWKQINYGLTFFFFFLLGAENMITKDNKDNKREK